MSDYVYPTWQGRGPTSAARLESGRVHGWYATYDAFTRRGRLVWCSVQRERGHLRLTGGYDYPVMVYGGSDPPSWGRGEEREETFLAERSPYEGESPQDHGEWIAAHLRACFAEAERRWPSLRRPPGLQRPE